MLATGGPARLVKTILGGALAVARAVSPAGTVDSALDAGAAVALGGLADELAPPRPDARAQLPLSGLPHGDVLSIMTKALEADELASGLASGAAFGGLYHALGEGGAAATTPLGALHAGVAASAARDTNQLYPGVFPSARVYEAECVSMMVGLLRGVGLPRGGPPAAPEACGLFTSGGTESVLLAVKAQRDVALAALGFPSVKGGVPPVCAAAAAGLVLNIVAGTTAHPALDKACGLFGLRLLKLPVDPLTQALPPAAVAAALTPLTLLVYASAPSFSAGVVDDVPALGAVAGAYARSALWGARGVPLHVDNCLGGVLLSFLAEAPPPPPAAATRALPPFDFRASPAVATISLDLHKYAGAPKGASVLAFRAPALRRAAYFACADSPSGLYATPGLAGSRGGAPGALAWATLTSTGAGGYAAAAAGVGAAYAALAAGLARTPGLVLVGGAPHACVLAVAPAPGAPFAAAALAARMRARGWRVPLLQAPPAVQLVVTERLLAPAGGGRAGSVAEAWLRDMQACAAAAAAAPHDPAFPAAGDAGIYGAAAVLPAGEVDRMLRAYCDVLTMVR